MYDIAGFLLPKNKAIDPGLLTVFSEKQAHRGPDDLRFLGWRAGDSKLHISRNVNEFSVNAHVEFVHRRLIIIDECEGGWQPKSSACEVYAICFNGEIYNYVELREELRSARISFSSEGDSEVLLNALIHWSVEKTIDISFEEAAAALRERFQESVKVHLRFDVSVEATLSGKVDSSAVVMVMRTHEGDALAPPTFSFIALSAVEELKSLLLDFYKILDRLTGLSSFGAFPMHASDAMSLYAEGLGE
ncbi:MAG: hypothetical protein HWE34_06040 [Methylocystaceae bacterium]|nr:hypothetical protein [Methylocystaceae bacterium]